MRVCTWVDPLCAGYCHCVILYATLCLRGIVRDISFASEHNNLCLFMKVFVMYLQQYLLSHVSKCVEEMVVTAREAAIEIKIENCVFT